MMRQQLVENELLSRTSPAYRVPPDCRNGDRLDLRPGDTRPLASEASYGM